MTFKELYEMVMLDLDEDYSDTDVLNKIKKYINRAYKELAKKELLEKVKSSNVVDGKFKKPMDFFDIVEVKKDNAVIKFSVDGAYILADAEDGAVNLTYNYIPEPLEGEDDETETNEINIEYIMNYVKWLYFMSEGQYNEATAFKKEIDTMNIVKNTAKVYEIIDAFGVM